MVGREVAELFPKTAPQIGEVVLEVDGPRRPAIFHDVSFKVRAGEIVGLAGLVGAGRSEIARAVFGVDRYDAGTVGSTASRSAHDPAPPSAPARVRPRGPRKQACSRTRWPATSHGDPPRPRHGGVLHRRRRERAAARGPTGSR